MEYEPTEYLAGSWSSQPIVNVTARDPDPWFVETFGGGRSDTGIRVTPESALGHADIWQAVRAYAGTVATMRYSVRRRKRDGGMTEADQHPAASLLRRPNRYTGSWAYRAWAVATSLIYGNAVVEYEQDGGGRPVSAEAGGMLTMLPPETTRPVLDEEGQLWIETRVKMGGGQWRSYAVDPTRVIHIKGLLPRLAGDYRSFWGYGVIDALTDEVGGVQATGRHKRSTFRNRARPDGVIEMEGRMKEGAIESFRRNWANVHQGLDNSGRIAILEAGMKYNAFAMSNEDAQLVELLGSDTRKVANMFAMPASLLNMMEGSPFAKGVEELFLQWIRMGLGWMLKVFSEEHERKFFTPLEQTRMSIDFDKDELLKGNLRDRYAALGIAVSRMILTRNEARESEGYDPVEGGDEFLNPNTQTQTNEPDRQESTTEETTEESGPDNRAMLRLYADKYQDLVREEDNRVRRAAKREKNFVGWLDGFYHTEWPARLAGLTTETTRAEYCDERYDFWLAVTGKVTSTDQIVDEVDRQQADAGERARLILNAEFNPCDS